MAVYALTFYCICCHFEMGFIMNFSKSGVIFQKLQIFKLA